MAVALVVANKEPKHPARRKLAWEREPTRTVIPDPLRAVKPVPVNEGSFPW
jgi:hypothetical protein